MLDWTSYDRFDWENSQQRPMAAEERFRVEAIAAEVLAAPEAARVTAWGACSPPGRFAATVVHAPSAVATRFPGHHGGVGAKIFKTTADAAREATRAHAFHRQANRLPGLPNERVLATLDAGVTQAGGAPRGYVVQPWASGEDLEVLIKRRWSIQPLEGAAARSLLEQLLGQIVAPLWSVGVIWWDFRDANFVWDETAQRLTMIDVESLAAYADEILGAPRVWDRRDKGRLTALARLAQMTLRVVLAQGKHPRAVTARQVRAAWDQVLSPALLCLGKNPEADGPAAVREFLDRLAGCGLLAA